MDVIALNEIQAAFSPESALQSIKEGFIAYSKQKVDVPPVGYLGFKEPPGDCHIKYGYINDSPYFVIKVATGFFKNHLVNLPTSNGLMLVMSSQTGQPLALLQDEGWLTDTRTAIAGALAAIQLAPQNIKQIGLIGCGIQARHQLRWLSYATPCKKVSVWSPSLHNSENFAEEMAEFGFQVIPSKNPEQTVSESQLIVTTTPSKQPIIKADWVQPGTHITAVGADAEGKQELEDSLVAAADILAVDSKDQCCDHGEIAHAFQAGLIDIDKIVELGVILDNSDLLKRSSTAVSICDLTGVAVQDIVIATTVYESIKGNL
ncbi:ornithine cyclodeaminase family protein [Zooshikella harenae]|uniref:Ornithine cyclodeaminase family protein n=1 Tax=Zooshikella harenae TaxID=2827238 RepID=A0ABS5ZJS7_9GAMM|nr:ornithine cyclodeaminase family protein [Zooshikella harenae]MBU2713247.1 ornithine cyclodeaminase family protein [Zooshikella harenae]